MRFTRKQISKALLAARRLLEETVQPVAKVAVVLNPYMDCTEVQGATGPLQEDLRSAIFAVMGEAYRRENNVALAAKWYRRASQIFPGGHAPAYAHMVCEHQLAEFYDDALRTLQEHQRRRRAKPFIMRFVLQVRSWTNRQLREIAHTEKQDLQFLLEHVVSKAA
jgi:hypothetical protein